MATWLSGQLGILQTHGSVDLVAACAGFPTGCVRRCACSRRWTARCSSSAPRSSPTRSAPSGTSRMIFGDGASALVLGPAPPGAPPDIEVLQTYASGPVSQVNSIIWPNPEFDNNITVYGPEVKALVKRYLDQMIDELRELPDPEGGRGSLLDGIDLVVPHQANKTMVINMADAAGLAPERLYFNIETVGNPPRQHPPRHPRRGPRGCDRPADADFHPGVRCRRGGRLRGAPHRPRRSWSPISASMPSLMTVPQRHLAPSWKMSERRSEGDPENHRLAIVNRGQAVAWEQPGAPVTPWVAGRRRGAAGRRVERAGQHFSAEASTSPSRPALRPGSLHEVRCGRANRTGDLGEREVGVPRHRQTTAVQERRRPSGWTAFGVSVGLLRRRRGATAASLERRSRRVAAVGRSGRRNAAGVVTVAMRAW